MPLATPRRTRGGPPLSLDGRKDGHLKNAPFVSVHAERTGLVMSAWRIASPVPSHSKTQEPLTPLGATQTEVSAGKKVGRGRFFPPGAPGRARPVLQGDHGERRSGLIARAEPGVDLGDQPRSRVTSATTRSTSRVPNALCRGSLSRRSLTRSVTSMVLPTRPKRLPAGDE